MRLDLPEQHFSRHYADSLRHQLVAKTRLPLVCSRIINARGAAVYRIARLPALEKPHAS